ncbi:serine protease, partial [Streptomyces sp. NE06-03C]|nr:serine protease [Streptomyces sp. NE06-03C]
MNKPLVGAFLAALLLGAGAAPVVAAEPAQQAQEAASKAEPAAKAVTFAGTVALSNCSGSVVRTPDSAPTDP